MTTEPFQPLVVHDRGQLVDALISRRHACGMRGEDLDDRAGWADRLTAKLERPTAPSARAGFHFSVPTEMLPTGEVRVTGTGAVWLQALGLRFVLVDEATAERIGAVDAPTTPAQHPRRTGGDCTSAHATARQQRGIVPTMSAPAYETADRLFVARAGFRATITEHPWVAARPELQARAQAIEEAMAKLYEDVRQG